MIQFIKNGKNTSDATATSGDILTGKTAYIADGKTDGSMPNNGSLSYTPSESSQNIPAGYTSGGSVADITASSSYQACEALADDIFYGDYTPLEYITSTGTQYLDSGFAPSSNYKVQMTFLIDTVVAYDTLWGVYEDGSPARGNVWGNYGTSNFFVIKHATTYSKGQTVEVTIDTNIKYTLEVDYSTKSVYLDNEYIGTFTDSLTATSQTMTILNAVGGTAEKLKGRLYGFKIFDGNTLIQDLIPAIDSNNVVCMLDLVTGRFFYNQGTGTFTAGTVLSSN